MTKQQAGKNAPISTQRASAPVYPFTAIVGQDDMKLALLLNVIDPVIGGALIMGHRGTGKSTAVRALADLLPPVWKVRGCPFGCDPSDTSNLCAACRELVQANGKLNRYQSPVSVVELPLGATEDRVCGTIDIEKALKDGIKAFDAGLLARANRGFLYVDEVNLLEDHLVDLLLDVAVTGINTVEREGISLDHPARFVLVGSGNPEEGELRPQLVDRFGLYAEVRTVDDLDQRVRIVELREEFERDSQGFRAKAGAEQETIRRKLVRARKLAGSVVLSKELLRGIAALCMRLKIDGHRGELTIARAARALAAFEGRRAVNEEDVRRVAPLCLLHRLRRDPLEPTGGGARIERALENSFSADDETGENSNRQDANADASTETADRGSSNKKRSSSKADGKSESNFKEERSPSLVDASLPADAINDSATRDSTNGRKRTASGRHGYANKKSQSSIRGRYSRAVRTQPREPRIALDATIRAVALNSRTAIAGSTNGSPLINRDSLRFKQFRRKAGTLFILAIDTSGSMALNRIDRAKGALAWLLGKSYIRRDRVALIAFRGQKAEEVLAPSRSASRARKLLDELPMGGPTPLASALALALDISKRTNGEAAERVALFLFTDGRANVPLKLDSANGDVMLEVQELGGALRKAGVGLNVVDTQNRFSSTGEATLLAERLGARYVYLSSGSDADEELLNNRLLSVRQDNLQSNRVREADEGIKPGASAPRL
jgi:magnesium chelatase subunit D